jgi:hypothetical protein
MKQLFWFVLGMAVMIGGQAVAQMSTWTDNQGHSGTIYTQPAPVQPNWMGPSQQMVQQLQGILQSGQPRNPC